MDSVWSSSYHASTQEGRAFIPCPGSSGVEQWIENPRVGGSIPPPGTIQLFEIKEISGLRGEKVPPYAAKVKSGTFLFASCTCKPRFLMTGRSALASIVDFKNLPQMFPTNRHEPQFWEMLGRTVATYGFLEETLGKAIFSFTATRE